MGITRISSGDIRDSTVNSADLADDCITSAKLGIIGSKGDIIGFSTEPVAVGTGHNYMPLVSYPSASAGIAFTGQAHIDQFLNHDGTTGLALNYSDGAGSWLQITSALSGVAPSISAQGVPDDINIRLVPKGTNGTVKVGNPAVDVATISTQQTFTTKSLSSCVYNGITFNTLELNAPQTVADSDVAIFITGYQTGTFVLPAAGNNFYMVKSNPASGQTGRLTVSGESNYLINAATFDTISYPNDSALYVRDDNNAWHSFGRVSVWDKYKRRGVGVYHGIANNGTANNTATITAGQAYFLPYVLSCSERVSSLIARTIAGGAGSVVRVGLYRDDGNAGPGELIFDGGTATSTAATTTLTYPITGGMVLNPGLYWTVLCCSSTAPTVRGYAINAVYPICGHDSSMPTTHTYGWRITHTATNAFPSTITAAKTALTAVPLPSVYMEFV